MSKIHAVESDSNAGVNKALCGLTLISAFVWMYQCARTSDIDELLALRRRVRVYDAIHKHPYRTVSEYAEGEEGCYDINCIPCRRKLQDALDRHWGDRE